MDKQDGQDYYFFFYILFILSINVNTGIFRIDPPLLFA